MTTAVDVVNRSLQFIGAQTTITNLHDGSPAATAANLIYYQTVYMMMRQLDPDFARRSGVILHPTGAVPPPGWTQEYTYPVDALRIRGLMPATWDQFDPLPVRFNVGATVPQPGVFRKVIWANQADALATYTTDDVLEDEWDNLFAEAVARQLANPLSMALAGRPDFAKEILEQAARYEQMVDIFDESSAKGA